MPNSAAPGPLKFYRNRFSIEDKALRPRCQISTRKIVSGARETIIASGISLQSVSSEEASYGQKNAEFEIDPRTKPRRT